jgi:hypothetical protein
MSRVKEVQLIVAFFSCLAFLVWFAGCATTGEAEEAGCNPNIEYQVTPEAEVTQLKCEIGTHKGKPSLIFTAGVKNVSSEPLRYRLNIFLMDMDKAAGHLIPRKGKPPVLEPGKEKTVKIPFIKTTDVPKKVLVVVKTVGY